MVIYKIECEFDMPVARGYFTTREKAQAAIDSEDWSITGYTKLEIQSQYLVEIIPINVK